MQSRARSREWLRGRVEGETEEGWKKNGRRTEEGLKQKEEGRRSWDR
jgi:hypothetical protein